jgi:hypothetical protein
LYGLPAHQTIIPSLQQTFPQPLFCSRQSIKFQDERQSSFELSKTGHAFNRSITATIIIIIHGEGKVK